MDTPNKGFIHQLQLIYYRRKARGLVKSIYRHLDNSRGGVHITIETSPSLQRSIARCDDYLAKLRKLDPENAPEKSMSATLGISSVRATA